MPNRLPVALTLATAFALALAGCDQFSGGQPSIIGSWRPVTPDAIQSVTFSADGTVVVKQAGEDSTPLDFALDTSTSPATLIIDGKQGTIRFFDNEGEIEITDDSGIALRLKPAS